MVAKNLGVEAFGRGLAVRSQGPHVVGGVAAQIVTRRGRQVEQVEHLGSAHSDAELALLLSTAPERLAPGAGRAGPGRPGERGARGSTALRTGQLTIGPAQGSRRSRPP
jgi:hypothetical protein